MFGLGEAEWQAVALSLRVALVSTILGLPVALGLAYALSFGRFWGRSVLDALVHLPLVLPPVVSGYALLVVFGVRGPVGGLLNEWFGFTLAFRWTGAALAAGFMAMPLMVRAVRLSLEAQDPNFKDAAATLGAGPIQTFLRVTLPLCIPGLAAGAVLGFAKALGEFGATISFVGAIPGETQTLPLLIWARMQAPGGEMEVLRLSLVSVVLSLGALIASEAMVRRARRRHGEPRL